jgi:DNA topoisomerase-3
MTAARTLAAAQRLYEGTNAGALLTYPRTNSKYLPTDQAPRIKEIADQLAVDTRYTRIAGYVVNLDNLPLDRVIDDARVEDHHAIIPTGELPKKMLSGDDARVFDMVVRRFIAVFYPDAIWEDTEIITLAADERFRTRGSRLVDSGWQSVYDRVLADGEEGDVNPEAVGNESLNVIQQDERGSCTAAEVQEHQTRPPAHYSEASLLHEMERAGPRGLGTPATRAETIEKLVSVKYLERTGRTLRALGKGRMAIAILSNSPLTSAELTADWEERLYAIEHGNYSRDEFMAGIRAFTAQLVDYFRGMTADEVRAVWPVVGRCPNGDGDVRESKKAYGCTSWQSAQQPGCGFVIWKRICGRTISPGEAAALLESGSTRVLEGFRTDPSRGRLQLVNGQVRVVGDDDSYLDLPTSEREVIAACPKCRQSSVTENRRGFGCANWSGADGAPQCNFVIWKRVHGHQVTASEARNLIHRGQSGPHAFRSGGRDYEGTLELSEHFTVEVESSDGTVLSAGRSRRRVVPEPAMSSAQPVNGSAKQVAGPVPTSSPKNGTAESAREEDLESRPRRG